MTSIIDTSPQLGFSVPRLISVDDHVLEGPNVWQDRLPASRRADGPRMVRERGQLDRTGGAAKWTPSEDGTWADVWYYDDVVLPVMLDFVAVGQDIKSVEPGPVTFDDIRPGCYNPADRLADMDLNHTEAALCFPNTLPRFCGQVFAERADLELSLMCVRAYNDWLIDEWCGGPAWGRLIPATIVPLWDANLAADEVRRCAAKGAHAVTFSENPTALGLPSLYSGDWDPFIAACQETDTTICMHIGSSSRLPKTAPDAPHAVGSVLIAQNAAGSLIDFVVSGVLARFPTLKLAFSEANVGWWPYFVDRLDKVWLDRNNSSNIGINLPDLPSSYLKDRVFGCVVDDVVGIQLRERIGRKQICFEIDYPHGDSQWPNSLDAAREMISAGGMDEQEAYDFVRGNAIRAFGLERFGITR